MQGVLNTNITTLCCVHLAERKIKWDFFNASMRAFAKPERRQIYRTRRTRRQLSTDDVTSGISLPVSALLGPKSKF